MRGRTAARGYGSRHQKIRAVLAAAVAAGGVRCSRGAACKRAELVGGELVGGLIRPGEAWDLGHVDGDKMRYAGPEHVRCNRATAGRRRRRRQSRRW